MEDELASDEDKYFYEVKFREAFFKKLDSVDKACKKDRDTKYKNKSEKANQKKLGQGSKTRFKNLCTWLKIQEPELMAMWERSKK